MICIRVGGIPVRFSFGFFFVLSLICVISAKEYLAASACAILFHEGAHLLTMLLLRQKVKSVTFHGCGIRICPEDMLCSYRRELSVLLAGPLCNLAVCCTLCCMGKNTALEQANLALGLINLLPCRHLDGGTALHCMISLLPWKLYRCEQLLTVIACIVLLAMIGTAWFLDVRNFTYYALCIYLFFAEIFR